MIKKTITIAIICLLCICVLFACNPKEIEEEILPEQTILISTVAELVDIQNYTGLKYSNFTFELQNDIDLSTIDIWQPIGKDITTAFMGKFDGKNHNIANLTLKGWENKGNPIFVGKDTNVINETSYCSVGLFGYTKNTEISNLSLTGVNLYYYTEGVASYTAALVGFNVGKSKFSNITTDGSIKLANIFGKEKTYDDKGNEQGNKEVCPTVQYVSGVVAYSSGNSTFNDITSNVAIENAVYKAIYREADEENEIIEGYDLRYGDAKTVLPEQVLAGGIFALHRGSTVNNVNSTSTINIKAKSSFLGGVVAALYSSSATNADCNGVTINGKVATKNTVGGAVALLDHSTYTDSTLTDVTIDEECLGNEVQASSLGGAVGYAYDGSSVTNIKIDELQISSKYPRSVLGGVLGIARDSLLKDCEILNGFFDASSLTRHSSIQEYNGFYANCGAIVGSIFGNSNISDCLAKVQNHYIFYNANGDEVIDEYRYNRNSYGTKKDSTTYVNEDGFDAVRFFKEGSLTTYLVAYAKFNNGVLDVIIYSEESKILSEQTYNNVDEITGSDSDSIKYKDIYFKSGKGIVDSSGGIIAFEGRDTTKYVFLSGIPNIDEDSLTVIVIA